MTVLHSHVEALWAMAAIDNAPVYAPFWISPRRPTGFLSNHKLLDTHQILGVPASACSKLLLPTQEWHADDRKGFFLQ